MKIIRLKDFWQKDECLVISNAIEVKNAAFHPDADKEKDQIVVQMQPTSFSHNRYIVDISFEQFIDFVNEPHLTVLEAKYFETRY